ncbi:unnamed protein product [Musa acuminata subsp. malaccensis]|uniref:(wild Malaysian banana) hypothetical protein n=1 Tax=Musa acuminata subsp. malaccensis TaxID=214687 RepID=A0A804J6S9_MUSAM|nr:unnamed protein product [Musa acuminata subsp. malaccensis]
MASSAAGNPYESGDENPYVLAHMFSKFISPSCVTTAYTRKRKDAERRGDEVYVAKLEKAYDIIMVSQLHSRKGLTFGSFKIIQVSKDIKYADKQPIVSWGPRYSSSDVKDLHISMAISAVFEFGEDEGKGLLMGRRILGSLPLVFCCIAVSSLGHTGLLNLI